LISDLTTDRKRTGHIIQPVNSLTRYTRATDFNETIPAWYMEICKTFGVNQPDSRSTSVPIKTIHSYSDTNIWQKPKILCINSIPSTNIRDDITYQQPNILISISGVQSASNMSTGIIYHNESLNSPPFMSITCRPTPNNPSIDKTILFGIYRALQNADTNQKITILIKSRKIINQITQFKNPSYSTRSKLKTNYQAILDSIIELLQKFNTRPKIILCQYPDEINSNLLAHKEAIKGLKLNNVEDISHEINTSTKRYLYEKNERQMNHQAKRSAIFFKRRCNKK
jgi:hypothetical protein